LNDAAPENHSTRGERKMKKAIVLVVLGCSVVVADVKPLKPEAPEFYVYKDAGSRENHFIPSGWMGDVKALAMSQREPNGFVTGTGPTDTCMKITYKGLIDEGQGWAGIYWQTPANNWGDKKGGVDLSNYKKLTFKARGEKGGERVEKFMMGGIQGQIEEGDTGNAESEMIELKKSFQEYTIDLAGLDLTHTIGGFGLVFSSESNEKGATVFVDDVRYVQ